MTILPATRFNHPAQDLKQTKSFKFVAMFQSAREKQLLELINLINAFGHRNHKSDIKYNFL